MGKQEINGAGGGEGVREGEGTRGWRGTRDTWLLVTSVTQQPPEVTGGQKARNPLLLGVTGVGGGSSWPPPSHTEQDAGTRAAHGDGVWGQKGDKSSVTPAPGMNPRMLPLLCPASVSLQRNGLWGSSHFFFPALQPVRVFGRGSSSPGAPPKKLGEPQAGSEAPPTFCPASPPALSSPFHFIIAINVAIKVAGIGARRDRCS